MRPALPAVFVAAASLAALPAAAQTVTRAYPAPTAPIAGSVTVPTGFETIYLSGALPAPETIKGNTEAQAASVLDRLEAQLKGLGLGFGDVVKMTVFLAGDPATGKMDFAGWQSAYVKRFGTPAQPNRPARSTVQVAALAAAGALIEVEVIAVRRR